jgi:glutamine amidotransferase
MRDAMRELRQRNLIEPIRDSIAAGRPFLGICLGLQLLFEIGQEVQRHEGLGILPGEVVRFDLPAEYKVPHMGWNTLDVKRNAPILDGLPEHPYLYFVHSFHVVPTDTDVVAATTTYGEPFCSMIWRDRLFATQFHPEKSQSDGLRILRNFGDLA